ncbi:TRAP transporter large permease [uncultured Oscillibacter sp.]|uniref:TRAP transporter large permease n=1 Tax=uncultured Oscillibacter sp. TaxID=876091 RepID=UPI0025CC91D9|nr:TRAP transporter large permease [uncultured Oscillibacter sp.]
MQVLVLFLIVFLAASLLLRVPVAFGIGLGGAVVFTVYGYSMNSFSQTAFYGLDNFSLLAIPFFLFAGAIMEYSGISKSIFNFIDAFVGRVRASTGTVAVFACALFGALTGSTQATIAAIGKIVFPEMDKRGYEPAYQAALMASAGFLGVLIPPSMTGIIYATASGISIADAWMCTLIPGILLAALFSIVNYFHRIKVEPKVEEPFVISQYVKHIGVSTKNAFWALLMPVIIFGGIYGGIFTATEAGAISALYGLIYYFIRRKTRPESVSGSLRDMMMFTISLTGVILLIMAFANVACKAIAFSGISQQLVVLITENISSPIVFLLIVNVLFIICGMFIDSNAAILLFVPLLTPIADAYGINQVQMAGIILVNLCMGAISPPFCVNVFVTTKLKKTQYVEVVHYIWPFLGCCAGVLILMMFIPGLSTWLPALLK